MFVHRQRMPTSAGRIVLCALMCCLLLAFSGPIRAEAAEIRIWFNSLAQSTEIVQYLEANLPDDIRVVPRLGPWRGAESIAAIARGEYDLIVSNATVAAILEDQLMPLDDWILRDRLDFDALEYLVHSMRVRGQLYDLPISVQPMVVMYNRDVFDTKGIAYPQEDWTWEDFRELATHLTEDRDSERFYGAEAALGLWQFIVWSGGYGLADAPESLLDESFDLWTEMALTERTLGLHLWEEGRGWSNYFGRELAAMQVNNLNGAFFQANHAVQGSQIRWGVAPLPRFPGLNKVTPTDRVISAGIPRASTHQTEAWEVLKLLIQPEAAPGILAAGGLPAALSEEMFERYESAKAAVEPRMPIGLDSWTTRPLYHAGRGDLDAESAAITAMHEQLQRLLDGHVDSVSALANVKEAIKAARRE